MQKVPAGLSSLLPRLKAPGWLKGLKRAASPKPEAATPANRDLLDTSTARGPLPTGGGGPAEAAALQPPGEQPLASLVSRRGFTSISEVLATHASPTLPLNVWQRVAATVILTEFPKQRGLYEQMVAEMKPMARLVPITEEHIADNPALKSVRAKARQLLGQFVHRDADIIPAYNHEHEPKPLTQEFSHMERNENGVWTQVAGTTLDSVAIKHDRLPKNAAMLKHNANLGAITSGGRLVAGRSARADTPERVQELLLNTALAARKANGGWEGATGVHRTDAGNEYRGVILTALDLSYRKNLFMQLKPGGEPERKMISHLEKSVKKLFGESDSISCTLDNGETIRLRRPLIVHLPMSQEAGYLNIGLAHRFNRRGAVDMFQDLARAWQQGSSPRAQDLAPEMLQQTTPEQVAKFLGELTPESYKKSGLSGRETLALDALRIMVHDRDASRQTFWRPSDPERELHAMQELFSQSNTAIHAQCKSGQDRTLTAVTTLAARHVLEEQSDAFFFDPRLPQHDQGVESAYRLAFTNLANALGETPIAAVRSSALKGKQGKAKIAGKPIPDKRYLPYSEAIGLKAKLKTPFK